MYMGITCDVHAYYSCTENHMFDQTGYYALAALNLKREGVKLELCSVYSSACCSVLGRCVWWAGGRACAAADVRTRRALRCVPRDHSVRHAISASATSLIAAMIP